MNTQADYLAMLARLEKNRIREQPISEDAVEREIPLHAFIMAWCAKQVPQIPYIHARTDLRSSIAKGANDFTLFLQGKVLCIEVKTRTGKLSRDQVIWKLLMERQGFNVACIRSQQEFLDLVL